RKRQPRAAASKISRVPGLTWLLRRPARLANTLIGGMTTMALMLALFSPLVPVVQAAPDVFNLHTDFTMDGTTGTAGTQLFDDVTDDFTWSSVLSYPTGGDPGEIAAGDYVVTFYFTVGVPQNNAKANLEFTLTYGATTIGTITRGYKGNTSSPDTVNIATGYPLLTLDENPAQPLRLRIRFVSATNSQTVTMSLDDPAGGGQTVLNTPAITVPEFGALILPVAVILPPAIFAFVQRRRGAAPEDPPNA
ncbi:MAG: hypothetical protein ACE5NC_12715, partial [Anaerolineae bacterium]